MNGFSWCRANLFDASALVKLVADDADEVKGKDEVRAYYWRHAASVYSTSHCIDETRKAFKRKLERGRITLSQYNKYVRDFELTILGCNLRRDDMPVQLPAVDAQVNRLDAKYGLGFSDCLQIVTLIHGRFSVLGPNSKSILITADRGLARAARAEHAKVWECTTEPSPS